MWLKINLSSPRFMDFLKKLVSKPFIQIPLSLAVIFVPVMLFDRLALRPLMHGLVPVEEVARVIRYILLTPLFILAYRSYFRWTEQRTVIEMSLSGMGH